MIEPSTLIMSAKVSMSMVFGLVMLVKIANAWIKGDGRRIWAVPCLVLVMIAGYVSLWASSFLAVSIAALVVFVGLTAEEKVS